MAVNIALWVMPCQQAVAAVFSPLIAAMLLVAQTHWLRPCLWPQL